MWFQNIFALLYPGELWLHMYSMLYAPVAIYLSWTNACMQLGIFHVLQSGGYIVWVHNASATFAYQLWCIQSRPTKAHASYTKHIHAAFDTKMLTLRSNCVVLLASPIPNMIMGAVVKVSITATWNVLSMIWRSWFWTPAGSKLECVVLLSKSYLGNVLQVFTNSIVQSGIKNGRQWKRKHLMTWDGNLIF